MKYIVDMDGVLADFNTAFAKLLDPEGTIIPVTKGTWPEMWNWPYQYFPKEYVSEAWDTVRSSPCFWRELEDFSWTSTALLSLRKKQRRGDEVYFVTARRGTGIKIQTERWLQRRGFWNPTVIVVLQNKWGIISDVGADVVIDDKPKNLTDTIAYAKTKGRLFLQVHPYNMLFAEEHAERLGIIPVATPIRALEATQ